MRGTKKRRASYPVITSLCVLHTLDHSEMFMELYREEEREEGDRGGQEEKRGSKKRGETDPASNQFPKCSPPSGKHKKIHRVG